MVERLKAGAARAAAPEGALARAPARDHAHHRGPLYLRLGPKPGCNSGPMRAGSTSMLGQTLGGTRSLFRYPACCGGHPARRNRSSSGAEPPGARPGHIVKGLQVIDSTRPAHVLSPRPRPRAQVSASLRPCGRAELALPRRCVGCRPDGAAPSAKVFSWPLISSRRYTGLLWSTSGPIRSPPAQAPAGPG